MKTKITKTVEYDYGEYWIGYYLEGIELYYLCRYANNYSSHAAYERTTYLEEEQKYVLYYQN